MSDSLTGGDGGQTPVHPDDLEGLRLRWVQTQGQLDEAERRSLLDGWRWAMGARRTVSQVLDDRFLFRLHRECFGLVWAWAGHPRRRATSIGIDAHLVLPATRDALRDAEVQIAAAGDGQAVQGVIASLHHRLNHIHPFANGNGRTIRLHSELVARALGQPAPRWGKGDPLARERYLDALRSADGGDVTLLVAFMWGEPSI